MGYLRGAWLRSPLDLSFSFASEQAIDQLAYLLKTRPLRIPADATSQDARWLGVLDAAARSGQVEPRRAAANVSKRDCDRAAASGSARTWRPTAARSPRSKSTRRRGRVVAITHLYGAIDAGLAVNPGNIENQISGQLVQTASRMLKEEVRFDTGQVTSLDWNSYPILRFEMPRRSRRSWCNG